ncbi:MAG: peptidase S1, partial [Pseudomonadota bacterium]
LSPGFGSNTTTLTAGGSIQANRGSCTYGFVASAPDLKLNYEGTGPLYFSVESDGDTTLLVNQPDVSWICDDDSLGDSNPLLVLPNATEGVYDIWVGTYGDQMQSATLTISETDPR